MRASDKAKIRQRRIAHTLLVVFSFSLMFLGKLDLNALRSARMGMNDFTAPFVDLVSAPVRGVEVTARAVTAPGGAFAHTVLVANGREQGIERGNPVVTADGLVGLVVDVGATYARVLMISDINAQIPVILSSSSWPGVTVGNNGTFLSLRFLPEEAAPKVGELVLTSGHGGVLPAGVPVGRVDLVRDDFVRVRPAVDLRHLSYVSILVGGTEGIDLDNLALEDYYTPLPETEGTRLFEGVNAAGERQ